MRLLLGILLSIIPIELYGQVPNYFMNDPKWVCGLWNSNQWIPPHIEFTTNHVYYLNGDSTIDGNLFHKVYSRGETTYAGPIPTVTFDGFTGYYIRQDNRNIRFWTGQIGIDSLLVSYDYQVGDTVRGDIFQACYPLSTIQKIDSVFINAEYRKVFFIDSISGPVITEGIGHQNSINDVSGEFIIPLCQGIGFDYYIYCFGYGTTAYWDSQGTNGNCFLNVGIVDHETLDFEIKPNPFSNFLNIKVNSNSFLQFQLYDTSGKLLFNRRFKNEINVPTSFLLNGIYFYALIQDSVGTRFGKLIKTN